MTHNHLSLLFQNKNGFLFAHMATFLLGVSGLFGKLIDLSPHSLTLGRVVFASLALSIVIALTKGSLKLYRTKDFLGMALTGVILAFHWSAFFQSIQIGSVAIGLLTFATFPAFAALLEPLFFKERLDWKNIALSMLCFIGVGVTVESFDLEDVGFQAILWGVGAGLSFVFLSLLNRHYISIYSNKVVTFYQCFVAALCLLPFGFHELLSTTAENWGLLIILGVVFTALAHSLFIESMKKIKVQTAGIIASLEPVYGIVLAWVLLNESLSWRMFAGGIIILIAVFLVSNNKKTA